MCSLFYIYLKSLQYVFVILWVLACSTQPCAASSICSEDSYLNKEDLQMTELCNKAGETPDFLFTPGVQRGEALLWGKERVAALSGGKAP